MPLSLPAAEDAKASASIAGAGPPSTGAIPPPTMVSSGVRPACHQPPPSGATCAAHQFQNPAQELLEGHVAGQNV